ncbi:hypothetical protein [Pleionea sediminis]|uniref:hypothetical protein n=1 Tax=Pleionea sediminis TaxID=2569479 RepID=UPI001184D6C6|nr:hypothetical protein [Pleionea sediminis]
MKNLAELRKKYFNPQFEYKFYEDPHYAIVCFVRALNKEDVSVYNSIFKGDPPGFGYEWGSLCGFFDEEWMPTFKVPKFQAGEYYVVSLEDDDNSIAIYSRDELGGWLALGLSDYNRDILKIYMNVDKVLDSISKKLNRQSDWSNLSTLFNNPKQ